MKKLLYCLSLLLLAACDRAPSLTPQPAGIEGTIDGKAALAFLYGPFDAKLEGALWHAKDLPDEGPGAELLDEGDEAIVSIALAQAVKEGDAERFYFGSIITPKPGKDEEAFDCETCRPAAGATVFVKRGGRWVVETHAPFIETMGFNGRGPGMELVAIGPARYGIRVNADWFHSGHTGSFARLWTVEAQKLAARFGVETGEENGGACSEDPKDELEACHEYTASMRFEPGPQGDRYDIRVVPSDPEWEYGDHGLKGEQLFRFNGQTYQPVASTVAPRAAVNPEPWSGPLPESDPVALVKAFLQADAWGLQTGNHWPLVTQFATWADAPGWDESTIIASAEILGSRKSGNKSEVDVRLVKLGRLGTDGEGLPTLDEKAAGIELRTFVLENVAPGKGAGPHWKIVEPQYGPHIAVGYAFTALLPQWCGQRDCSKTPAYRFLARQQQGCKPSPIPIDRACGQRSPVRSKS